MANSSDAATLGYYTTVYAERTGWTGGLLVLNLAGRPLEFQCTLPIRPSRAHEILFGNTLQEHLISEIIGPTLLQKSRTPISILCCQQIEALSLQENLPTGSNTVVGFIHTDDAATASTVRKLAGHETTSIGNASLVVAMEQFQTAQTLIDQLNDLVDVMEPFERITEAIREAQSQMARAA